jgi:hypothetical protein
MSAEANIIPIHLKWRVSVLNVPTYCTITRIAAMCLSTEDVYIVFGMEIFLNICELEKV